MLPGRGEQGSGADAYFKVIGDNHNRSAYQGTAWKLNTCRLTHPDACNDGQSHLDCKHGPDHSSFAAGSAMNTDGGGQPGQDYIVRYATSEYQNGTLVLRFTTPPGRKELLDAVADYGIRPASVRDISAELVPSLAARQNQPSRGAASWLPDRNAGGSPRRGASPGFGGPPQGDPAQYETTVSPTRSRTGSFAGRILGTVAVAFLLLSVLNVAAAQRGWEAAQYPFPDNMNRLEHCTSTIDAMGSYGEGGIGLLFSDWPTDFPVTPPNAAFLAGCLVSN